MAELTSGSIYFSGLGNGTDFATVITQLKDIELIPAKRMALWHADWERRYNAFQELRTELGNLRSSLLKMNSMDKFLAKSYDSSEPDKIGATVRSEAAEGTYKVEVNRLASNSILTLNTGLTSKSAKVNSTSASQQFTYDYKGKSHTISVPAGTTLEGFKNLINKDPKNPGVSANIIDNNGNFIIQIMGKEQGAKATLSLSDVSTTTSGTSMSTDWNTQNNTSLTLTGVDTSVDGWNTVVNPSGVEKKFTINYNGVKHEIKLDAGATLQTLGEKLAEKNISTRIQDGVFEIYGKDPGTGAQVTIVEGDDVDGLDISKNVNWTKKAHTVMTCATPVDSPSDVINTTSAAQKFYYKIGATQHSVDVNPGATWDDLAQAIQAETPDVNVEWVPVGGKQVMRLSTERLNTDENISIQFGTTMTGAFSDASQWDVQAGENARYRINGWPAGDWLESSGNVVSGVIAGVDILLKDAPEMTGDPLVDAEAKIKGTLTVKTDMAKIRENIQEFVDAVNSVRTKIKELTAYDSNKSATEWDPAKTNNATSLFAMQKGSILTGNYGVQLLASQLKSGVADSAKGFEYSWSKDGATYGDLYTSLSQIGILTVAKEGQTDTGLLTIDWDKLDAALARDPDAVAELFASENKGQVDTYDFSYVSSVKGTTAPGAYNVSYTINPDGTISNPMIDGKPAGYDSETNQLTSMQGNSKGIALQIDNLAPGSYSGTVRIKEGKLVGLEKQVKNMLSEEGALKILENNYTDIMKNISTKIDKEEARVDQWERRQRTRFARLEALLGTYDALNKQVESQINSLSSSKSK